MGTDASRVQMVSGLSGRAQCWVESLILALGGPSAIWVVSKVIFTFVSRCGSWLS